MKNILILFCLLPIAAAAQLNGGNQSDTPNLSFFIATKGDTTLIQGETGISASNGGDIIIKVDPNDAQKEVFENTVQIELVHARGKSPVRQNHFTGIKEFADFDEKLVDIKPGDRIVIALKMMADQDQTAYVFHVK